MKANYIGAWLISRMPIGEWRVIYRVCFYLLEKEGKSRRLTFVATLMLKNAVEVQRLGIRSWDGERKANLPARS